jgi:glycosyltransferase involved in cell wall biosynthesis
VLSQVKIVFLSGVMHGDNPRALMMMNALQAAGHDVVALMAQTKSSSSASLDGIRHIGLPVPRANFQSGSRMRSLFRALFDRVRNAWRLYKLVLSERPDVCVCHEPDSWLVGLLAKRKLGYCLMVDLREVYTDRASAFPRILQGPVAAGTNSALRFLARRSDGIIHVSTHRANHYRLCHPNSVIVHHRCDPSLFAGIAPKRIAGSDGRLVFIHAGPLRLSYAAAEILTALESTRTSIPNVVLLVVGGSIALGSLQSIVDRLQRSGRLLLTPYVPRDEVAALIKGADVGLSLVLPVDVTHRLASPTKLFEYMEGGLPVVGSDLPEIHDVLTAWQCGLLVDASEPAAIASAFVRMATDSSLRKTLAENARAAATHFSWRAEQRTLVQFVAERLREAGADSRRLSRSTPAQEKRRY